MRLLPPNTYAADPSPCSLLRAWLSPGMLGWAEPQLTELGALAANESALLGEECERRLAGQDQDTAQRSARAFAAAEAWTAGLLKAAAGRGAREAAVFELWQARAERGARARDSFSLVVDGA